MIAIDGYDIIAVTFAMPGIGAEWGVSKALLGSLFSLGIIGMAVGCLILGPVADSVGRRPMAIFGLLLMMISMLFSILTSSFTELMIWRFVTGAGAGTIVSLAYPLAVEYSNLRSRPITLAMVVISFPLGSAILGLIVTQLMPEFGWRATFWPGIVLPPLIILCALRWLPEPLGLPIARPHASSLAMANKYLAWVGRPKVERLPPPSQEGRASIARVLGKEFGRVTAYLCVIYCLYSLTAYFLFAWLTQIVVDRGFEPSVAATVSVATNVGGVVGASVTGFAIRKYGIFPVLVSLLVGMAGTLLSIGLAPANLAVLRGLGALAGVFAFGPVVGFTLLISEKYPVEVRATGMGFIIGMSRWVAALGPFVGGILMSSQLGIFGSCVLMAASALVSASLLTKFHWPQRHMHNDSARSGL